MKTQLFNASSLEKRVEEIMRDLHQINDSEIKHHEIKLTAATRIEFKLVQSIVKSIKMKHAASNSHVVKIERQDMTDDGVQECIRTALSEISHKIPKNPKFTRVGRGAFGVVYRAPAVVLDDDIKGHKLDLAIKLVDLSRLFRFYAPTEETKIKFWQREVELATRAGAHDIGPRVFSSTICDVDGLMMGVYVMDYINGMDMDEYLEVCSKRNSKRVLAMAREQLSKLHDIGIFHSDLNFGNILVETHGKTNQPTRVFIIDYGLAKTIENLRENELLHLNHDSDVNTDNDMCERIAAQLVEEGSFRRHKN